MRKLLPEEYELSSEVFTDCSEFYGRVQCLTHEDVVLLYIENGIKWIQEMKELMKSPLTSYYKYNQTILKEMVAQIRAIAKIRVKCKKNQMKMQSEFITQLKIDYPESVFSSDWVNQKLIQL